MPIARFQLPDGRIARFEVPEGTTPEQAQRVMAEMLAQQPQQNQRTPNPGGIINELGRGAEGFVSRGRTAFESLSDPKAAGAAALTRQQAIAEKYGNTPGWDAVKKAYDEKGLLSAAGEYISQIPGAIAEQSPQIAASLGAARLGSAAGPYGAVAGAATPSYIQAYGSLLEREAQEQAARGEAVNPNRASAAAAAVPYALLDTAATFIPMGKGIVKSIFGDEVAMLLSRGATKEAEAVARNKLANEGFFKTLGKGTATGVAVEVPTEITQQMIERANAGLELFSPDALHEYGETAFQVSKLGPIGAAGRFNDKSRARGDIRQEQALKAIEERRAAEEAQRQEYETQQRVKSTPEYLLSIQPRVNQYQAQIDALRAEREEAFGKKPAKGASKEEKDAYYEAAREYNEKIKALYAEMNPLKGELRKYKKQIEAAAERMRLTGMTEQDVYLENLGINLNEQSAPAAEVQQEEDPQEAYLRSIGVLPEKKLTKGEAALEQARQEAAAAEAARSQYDRETEQLAAQQLEGLQYFNNINPLSDDAMVTETTKQLLANPPLARRVVESETPIPGLNPAQNNAVKSVLALQLGMPKRTTLAKEKKALKEWSKRTRAEEKQRLYDEQRPERLQEYADEQDQKYVDQLTERLVAELEAKQTPAVIESDIPLGVGAVDAQRTGEAPLNVQNVNALLEEYRTLLRQKGASRGTTPGNMDERLTELLEQIRQAAQPQPTEVVELDEATTPEERRAVELRKQQEESTRALMGERAEGSPEQTRYLSEMNRLRNEQEVSFPAAIAEIENAQRYRVANPESNTLEGPTKRAEREMAEMQELAALQRSTDAVLQEIENNRRAAAAPSLKQDEVNFIRSRVANILRAAAYDRISYETARQDIEKVRRDYSKVERPAMQKAPGQEDFRLKRQFNGVEEDIEQSRQQAAERLGRALDAAENLDEETSNVFGDMVLRLARGLGSPDMVALANEQALRLERGTDTLEEPTGSNRVEPAQRERRVVSAPAGQKELRVQEFELAKFPQNARTVASEGAARETQRVTRAGLLDEAKKLLALDSDTQDETSARAVQGDLFSEQNVEKNTQREQDDAKAEYESAKQAYEDAKASIAARRGKKLPLADAKELVRDIRDLPAKEKAVTEASRKYVQRQKELRNKPAAKDVAAGMMTFFSRATPQTFRAFLRSSAANKLREKEARAGEKDVADAAQQVKTAKVDYAKVQQDILQAYRIVSKLVFQAEQQLKPFAEAAKKAVVAARGRAKNSPEYRAMEQAVVELKNAEYQREIGLLKNAEYQRVMPLLRQYAAQELQQLEAAYKILRQISVKWDRAALNAATLKKAIDSRPVQRKDRPMSANALKQRIEQLQTQLAALEESAENDVRSDLLNDELQGLQRLNARIKRLEERLGDTRFNDDLDSALTEDLLADLLREEIASLKAQANATKTGDRTEIEKLRQRDAERLAFQKRWQQRFSNIRDALGREYKEMYEALGVLRGKELAETKTKPLPGSVSEAVIELQKTVAWLTKPKADLGELQAELDKVERATVRDDAAVRAASDAAAKVRDTLDGYKNARAKLEQQYADTQRAMAAIAATPDSTSAKTWTEKSQAEARQRLGLGLPGTRVDKLTPRMILTEAEGDIEDNFGTRTPLAEKFVTLKTAITELEKLRTEHEKLAAELKAFKEANPNKGVKTKEATLAAKGRAIERKLTGAQNALEDLRNSEQYQKYMDELAVALKNQVVQVAKVTDDAVSYNPLPKAQQKEAAEKFTEQFTEFELAKERVEGQLPYMATKTLKIPELRTGPAKFDPWDVKGARERTEHIAQAVAKTPEERAAETRARQRAEARAAANAAGNAAATPAKQVGDTALRVGEAAVTPIDATEAEGIVKRFVQGLRTKLNVVYANTFGELPTDVKEAVYATGVTPQTSATVKGAVLPDGRVVIIGQAHETAVDLESTLFHETFGHYGTDTMLGEEGLLSLHAAAEKRDGGVMGLAESLGVADEVQGTAAVWEERAARAEREGASKEAVADIRKRGKMQVMRELLATVEEGRPTQSFLQSAKRFIQEVVGAVRSLARKLGMANFAELSTSDVYALLRKSRRMVQNGTIGAYRSPNGDVAFRIAFPTRGTNTPSHLADFASEYVGSTTRGWNDTLASNMGLSLKQAVVDRWASVMEATRRAVDKRLLPQAQQLQMMYFARSHDNRTGLTAVALTQGAPTLVKDSKGNLMLGNQGGASMKAVVEQLRKAQERGIGNATQVRDLFDAGLKSYRALRFGPDKLNFAKPPSKEMLEKNIREFEAIPEFVEARRLYNEYNNNLIDWLVETGAIPKDVATEKLKNSDYVPFYRVDEKNNVVLDIGDRKPLTIGNTKSQPYLHALVGGDQKTQDFFTATVQNTSLLVDMGLGNMARKSVADALAVAGLIDTKKPVKGPGPDDGRTIRFKDKGEDFHVTINTDLVGIPADMLLQGMHGTTTALGGFVKALSIPSQILRTAVTRLPLYPARQIIRDSTSNFLVAGGNMTPVLGALKELKSMATGSNTAEQLLQRQGLIGGNILHGTQEDIAKILLQLTKGDTSLLAKADMLAMKADAASRVSLYNSYTKQGMSEMEASLAAMESMNFTKRGTSGFLYQMNMMVPFLNAQIQGLNVLYESMRGKLPLNDRTNAQRKLFVRGTLLALATLAYASMMQDDEAYKNAKLRDRLSNFFVRIPGVEEPIRIPIPYEAGLIFKAVPEAIWMVASDGKDSGEVTSAMMKMLGTATPIGPTTFVPQAVKPVLEVMLNKSFYTMEDLESARERNLLPGERYRDRTTAGSKLVGEYFGVSPIKIDALVNGYTGGWGLMLMQLPAMLLANDPNAPQAPEKSMSQLPLVGSAFQPNNALGQVDSFYTRAEEYEQAKRTFQKIVAEGDERKALKFAEEYANDIALAGVAAKFKETLSELTNTERLIKASSLTPAEKKAQIEEVRRAKEEFARAFNQAKTY